MTAARIRIESRNGFVFDALRIPAHGPRRGGVIVVQEIFGLSDHVVEMSERFADAGFDAIAPSMFDRAAPGFVVQPADSAAHVAAGAEGARMARENGPENAMADIGACLDLLAPSGRVFITGYCYGGSMAWLAASRLPGLSAASCYYGGNISQMQALELKCPVECHFGETDPGIPLASVEALRAARPDVPVYTYPAGHGFARRNGAHYDAAADALAFSRTLDLFARNAG